MQFRKTKGRVKYPEGLESKRQIDLGRTYKAQKNDRIMAMIGFHEKS